MGNPEDLKVKQLMEMGFPEAQCRAALEKAAFDLQLATEYLFQWKW